jgi:membrane protease YdiL (CAAX protease family)
VARIPDGVPGGIRRVLDLWCVVVPTSFLGWRTILSPYQTSPTPFTKLGATTHILLWCPLAFPFAFSFVPRIAAASFVVVIASVVLGIVIGVTEELLWRGLYVTAFPNRLALNTIYPSIAVHYSQAWWADLDGYQADGLNRHTPRR